VTGAGVCWMSAARSAPAEAKPARLARVRRMLRLDRLSALTRLPTLTRLPRPE
jgi:hypothetical protein